MRLATLACFVIAGSALALPVALPQPAAAQWLGPTLEAQRYDNLRRHQQRVRANQNKSSWSRHVRACARRYPSYNSRTDRYVVRRGVTARCRL